jgi:F-type H+-transporting ATPase subunit b
MKAFMGRKRARCVISLLVVVSVLFAFGLVWASSEAGGHGGGHGGEGGVNKTKDLIFRIMNFAVLAGALFFLLRKPVAKGLEARRQGIKDQLEDLERQQQEAEKQLAEEKQKLARLDKEVEKIMAEYVKEGEAAKARIIEEGKVAAEKLREQAKKNLAHEFQKAKEQLKAEMAEEAVAMAEDIIRKNINAEDQKRIVDEYLTKVVVAQ